MLKIINRIFKSLVQSSAALEKKSERLLFESQAQLNEYIKNNGGIEKIKDEQRKAEEFLKLIRKI